jgi:16S rRNA (cytosine967-C5)-methyltransferase
MATFRKSFQKAVDILLRVEASNSYVNLLLDAIPRAEWDRREFALLEQLVKGTLQWRGKVDATLDRLLSRPLDSLPAPIRAILRLGTYQLLFLERMSAPSAINQWVELAKRFGHKGTANLVNGVLRNVSRERDTQAADFEPPGTAEEISAHYSHPEWMIARWLTRFSVEETIALCTANNSAPPLCIRTNTLRTTTDSLREALTRESIPWRPAPFLRDCTVLE